jgi:hypothetical protein
MDIIELNLEFAKVVRDIEGTGGIISPQIPNANWRYVEGNMTPDQLRIIADRIEQEFKG